MVRGMMAALAVAMMTLGASGPASADPKFEAFIQEIWPRAEKAGISRDTFERAFAGISEPDPLVLKLANNQPEVTSTTSAYLEKAVTPARIEAGQLMKVQQAQLLSAIEKRYKVDRHILLAIWGMESNFGINLGSMRVMQSLATLLYSGNRKDYAREQIIAALRILQRGAARPEAFYGSWAGAMGHTQFIPTSYLSFAVDWTGDGRKDIWGSSADALASTANYLAKAGWQNDRPWGWEITLPKGFNKALIGRNNWKTVTEWVALGIKPAGEGKFGAPQAEAFVMVPQGTRGPAFLVTRNFLAIMYYNLSHSYALAVGHIGDRIRGGEPFIGTWPDVTYDLTHAERVELQTRLSAAGYETGGSDGRFGARTYEAIIAFQKSAGLDLDGVPSKQLLERLRREG